MSFLIHHLLANVFNIFMSMLALHACRPLKVGIRGGGGSIYIYSQHYPTIPNGISHGFVSKQPWQRGGFVCQGWLLALGKRRGFRGHMFAGNW